MRRLLVVAFLVVACVCRGDAAPPDASISMGPLTLRIGSDERTAMADIDKWFFVMPVPEDIRMRTFHARADTPQALLDLSGGIFFQDGKLESAMVDWLPARVAETARTTVDTLYKAVRKITSDGPTACRVRAVPNQLGREVNVTIFECGAKTVRVGANGISAPERVRPPELYAVMYALHLAVFELAAAEPATCSVKTSHSVSEPPYEEENSVSMMCGSKRIRVASTVSRFPGERVSELASVTTMIGR